MGGQPCEQGPPDGALSGWDSATALAGESATPDGPGLQQDQMKGRVGIGMHPILKLRSPRGGIGSPNREQFMVPVGVGTQQPAGAKKAQAQSDQDREHDALFSSCSGREVASLHRGSIGARRGSRIFGPMPSNLTAIEIFSPDPNRWVIVPSPKLAW